MTQRLAALRFFFVKTLHKPWSADETPYPKKVLGLPAILSQAEVARLIDAAHTPFHRIVRMTLYATGVRRAAWAHLQVSDMDSQRRVIHVQGGKGRKDREVRLSPKLREALREHGRGLRRQPAEWLFPGNRWHTASHPIDTQVAWQAGQAAAQRAGIQKEIHPHTLRHASAYYTTFQSPFILKTIVLGRARSAGVYGRRAGPLSLVPGQPAETSLFSR